MLGTRDEFSYLECKSCGCLQLLDQPDDLSPYYDSEYYSFKTDTSITKNPIKKYLKKKVLEHYVGTKNFTGLLLSLNTNPPPFANWVKRTGINFSDSILDVGTGSGALLTYMRGYGFENLAGCDPFIPEDTVLDETIRIRKCELADVDGSYDLVIFNHSFEHLADPLEALKKTRQLMRDSGWALIRIPVAGSATWDEYGVDWVQLDAPRHFWLHTMKSLEILARNAGLRIAETVFDSTAFQYWGSEQYRGNIPLFAENSYLRSPEKSIFNGKTILAYQEKAKKLNEKGLGDQASFYLKKIMHND